MLTESNPSAGERALPPIWWVVGMRRFPQDATKLSHLICAFIVAVEDATLSLGFKRHDGGQNRSAWP